MNRTLFPSIPLLLALLIPSGGCTREETAERTADDRRIYVSASTAEQLSTRAYTHKEGPVRSGQYYLHFYFDTYYVVGSPHTATFSSALVDFDDEERMYKEKYYAPSVSIDNREGVELKWSHITKPADVKNTPDSLYMDNMPAEPYGKGKTVTFSKVKGNTFTAGPMDDANDLLWDGIPTGRTSKYVDFNLHHVMAGVRVKVTIDADYDSRLTEPYDLSQAQVYITNLILDPKTYSRTTGTVTVDEESPAFRKLVLVNTLPADNLPDEMKLDGTEYDADWPRDETGDVRIEYNGDTPTYTTLDFILPPQTILSESRPQLVVRFANPLDKDGTKPYLTFFGNLPHAMETHYPSNNYSMDLAFLREHILEIRTKISQNPPQLTFMPVRLYDWIPWGPYTLAGNQTGLYSELDLKNVATFYEKNDTGMLERFAEQKEVDGKGPFWVFDIWRQMKLTRSEVESYQEIFAWSDPDGNPVDGKHAVHFRLHRYKITIVDDETQAVLHVIDQDNVFNDLMRYGKWPSAEDTGGTGN